MRIQTEREADGRWIAEVVDLPGVLAYGATREDALARVKALALSSKGDTGGVASERDQQIAFRASILTFATLIVFVNCNPWFPPGSLLFLGMLGPLVLLLLIPVGGALLAVWLAWYAAIAIGGKLLKKARGQGGDRATA